MDLVDKPLQGVYSVTPMRSQYQPAGFHLPRAINSVETSRPPLGGVCREQANGRRNSKVENAIAELLAPLVEHAQRDGSRRLQYSPVGEFHHGACRYCLPRFVFRGPPGGHDPIRLGLFAAIHGDEPEGAFALRDFLLQLHDDPARAQGYELYVYPVCNPTGFEDRTRHSRANVDLNREFWNGSRQPEVYFLERELGVLQFAGLVALHSDDTCDGVYAYVRGATLTEALAKPALNAAASFLPLATGEIIDGFPAHGGLISQCYEGVLCNPAELNPLPFEIIFETPQGAPFERQTAGAVAALDAVLREYRQFLAYGQDL